MSQIPKLFASFVALALLALSASTCVAETQIALDLDSVFPIARPNINHGGGGALRLGQQVDLGAVTVTGEFGANYHAFGGSSGPTLYAGFAGGRLRLGKILEPGVFLHVAASHLADSLSSSWAPMIDMGLSLDLTVLPLVEIGIHGNYVRRFANSETATFEYIVLGPHVALVF